MIALGKKPARAGAVSLKFKTYFDAAALPKPPMVFGRTWLVPNWQMFSNDTIGCCVWSGAAHETMLWRAEAASPVAFSDASVLSDYSAATGYDPADPSTDQGTDVQQAAAYRQKVGVIDAGGARHKIDAYVALAPGDLDQLAPAAFVLGAVGIGIQLPDSAIDQFGAGEPWTVVAGSSIEGGHYVPILGRNGNGDFLCVTWGRLHAISPTFLQTYMDEGVGYLSAEMMRNNLSPRGFDKATLQSDLALLKGQQPKETTAAPGSPRNPELST